MIRSILEHEKKRIALIFFFPALFILLFLTYYTYTTYTQNQISARVTNQKTVMDKKLKAMHSNQAVLSAKKNASSSAVKSSGSANTIPSPTPKSKPVVKTYNTGVYLGFAVEPITSTSMLELEKQLGKNYQIVMGYKHWGDPQYAAIDTAYLEQYTQAGKIPLISWEPWDPAKGIDQPEYQLKNITEGKFDTYIRNSAQSIKAYNKPLFLRFAHEMNGNWYPWGGTVNKNSATDYKNAWKHVYNIFQAEGVTNVTWVWSPDTTSYPNFKGNDLADYYPGNDYVDWIGLDGYNWGPTKPGKTWQSFDSVFASGYRKAVSLGNKPIMIAETASAESGGNKAAWIKDALSVQIPENYPRIKALIWFNIYRDNSWPITTSSESEAQFKTSIKNKVYGYKPIFYNGKIISP